MGLSFLRVPLFGWFLPGKPEGKPTPFWGSNLEKRTPELKTWPRNNFTRQPRCRSRCQPRRAKGPPGRSSETYIARETFGQPTPKKKRNPDHWDVRTLVSSIGLAPPQKNPGISRAGISGHPSLRKGAWNSSNLPGKALRTIPGESELSFQCHG